MPAHAPVETGSVLALFVKLRAVDFFTERALRPATLAILALDVFTKLDEVDEVVGLAAQVVGDHGRLGLDRGDDRDAYAAPLHGFDQAAEITVAGEEHHMV